LNGAGGAAIVAAPPPEGGAMTQTTNRFLDEIAKLMTDAAGAADGVRREIAAVVRAQSERILHEMDVVQREEFEAVKAMAEKARAENERLEARIAQLEAALAQRKDAV
jgi:BMFP domain-containing protein YqiC